jgi:hypothetical protein
MPDTEAASVSTESEGTQATEVGTGETPSVGAEADGTLGTS